MKFTDSGVQWASVRDSAKEACGSICISCEVFRGGRSDHALKDCVALQWRGLEQPSGPPSEEGALAALHGISASGAGM